VDEPVEPSVRDRPYGWGDPYRSEWLRRGTVMVSWETWCPIHRVEIRRGFCWGCALEEVAINEVLWDAGVRRPSRRGCPDLSKNEYYSVAAAQAIGLPS
jgi:hypothetical protein